MTTAFPGGVDSLPMPTATDLQDAVGLYHDELHSNVSAAIMAIETELGQNPRGDDASVADRLDAMTAAIAAGGVGRQTATATTASLATGAAGDVSIALATTYRLLSIATSQPARVRVYASAAARTADASRAVGTDPGADSGLMLEYVTTDTAVHVLSPMVVGASMETVPSADIPVSVTNNGDTGAVTVTMVWEAME